MSLTEIVLITTELLGTVSFALSGALVAIDRELDAFGVVFIACITTTGGGIIRDVMIGRTPPWIFENVHILLIAVVVSILTFLIAYRYRDEYHRYRARTDAVNGVFDAIGLAAFTVIGTQTALDAGFGGNVTLCAAVGMTTGIGGGILRDMMTNAMPYVFIKHIYALASIAGSLVYYFAITWSVPTELATFVAMVLVVVIRLCAARFRWSMPRIRK